MKPWPSHPRGITTWLSLVPGVAALLQGTLRMLRVRETPLDPDAINYLALAENWSLESLWSGSREPVWITLFAAPVKIFGSHPTLIRAGGVAAFVALVVTFQFVLTRLSTRSVGWLGALLVACSPWLIFQAPRGLREEASAAGLLLIAAAASRWSADRTAWWVVSVFSCAAILALLRWDTLLMTVPTLLLVAVVRRLSWRKAALGMGAVLILVSPLLIGNYIEHGDPLYHSNVHANFFRNVEFAGQHGLPSADEVASNAYAGPYETWSDYLFKYRTTGELAANVASGAFRVSTTPTSLGFFYPAGADFELSLLPLGTVVLAVFGAWLVIRVGVDGPWPFVVIWLATILASAPIAHLFDWRLALANFPFTLLLALLGASACWSRASEYLDPAVAGEIRPSAAESTWTRDNQLR